jgi:DNA replication and repair protein RecF
MSLEQISLHNIRSYNTISFTINPATTVIIGKNGSGKTSILESIYLLYRGTSFRGRDRDVIHHDELNAVSKAAFQDNSERRVALHAQTDGKIKKEFTTDGKKSSRLNTKQKLPLVLFEPDELRLLTSSPQRRRDFIDGIIGRLSPTYSTVLGRFARTLLQRNELLKQFEHINRSAWESHMFAWDIKLAELSASIIKARRNFVSHSNEHLSRLYSELADDTHTVLALYESEFQQDENVLQQSILHALEHSRQSDGLRGFTTVGPHRDDITMLLNGKPANDVASRGELRTIMLSYKLLEVELQKDISNTSPLILMDDVFSELDTTREQKLMHALQNYQTIITATDLRKDLTVNASIIKL